MKQLVTLLLLVLPGAVFAQQSEPPTRLDPGYLDGKFENRLPSLPFATYSLETVSEDNIKTEEPKPESMPVFEPDPGVHYSMKIHVPDTSIRYNMKIDVPSEPVAQDPKP